MRYLDEANVVEKGIWTKFVDILFLSTIFVPISLRKGLRKRGIYYFRLDALVQTVKSNSCKNKAKKAV